jgi:hypothetical protein
MTLSAGTRLGQYEIVGAIGAGGMGEVYKARDTRLQRDVAVKILADLGGADPDRTARFQREAQLLASLNHPHIAQIYGVEDAGGLNAIVMEFVDGPTLADRIGGGALPPAEVLTIARQIADALDAAHEQGIIHRDLKPANIKVRDDGTVKVLDFGLAKALDPAGASNVVAMNSPTLSVRATMQGVILGTAAYMAPEQAKGRPVDKRADIWAFGAVLYEMLTGRPTFAGDSTAEILGAVVLKDPDWSALPASTSPALVDLLRRCLQKDARQRQRDIGDVRIALDEIASGRGAANSATQAAIPSATRATRTLWFAIAPLAAGIIGLAVGWTLPRPPPPAVAAMSTRLIVAPPTGRETHGPALSPDGRFVVVAGDRLYLREFTSFAVKALPGTDGAATPFVSADSKWVGFIANGKIKKVAIAGGDPLIVCDANADTPGGAWGPNNTILFSPGWNTGLFTVSADGGQPLALTHPDPARQERGHWWPEMLPDGASAIFTVWRAGTGINDARVAIFDFASGKHTVLFAGADGHYLPTGHILYFHAGGWHLVGFDLAARRTIGEPAPVLADAMSVTPTGSPTTRLAAAAGAVAFRAGSSQPLRELAWADRQGKVESLGFTPQRFENVSLSQDGRRIVAARLVAGSFELWTYDVSRKTEEHLAIAGSNNLPAWSRSGDRIAFNSIRKGDFDVYTAAPDGTRERPILTDDFDQVPQAWDRDGRRLIVGEWHHDGSRPLTVVDTMHEGKPEIVVPGNVSAESAQLSPDDRWLTYVADQAGRAEVYVQPFPGSEAAVRVSSRGGVQSIWSPARKELFYRRANELVSVEYRDDHARFEAGDEKILFTLPSFGLGGVAPDGQRFLILRLTEPEPEPGVRVILNWLADLNNPSPRQ